jgi:hypothetical protein
VQTNIFTVTVIMWDGKQNDDEKVIFALECLLHVSTKISITVVTTVAGILTLSPAQLKFPINRIKLPLSVENCRFC